MPWIFLLLFGLLCSCSSITSTNPNPSSTSITGSSSSVPSLQWEIHPQVLATSDSEIPNPLRGQYLWNGVGSYPSTWPAQDVYQRYNWIDIEPTRGNIQWDIIDQQVQYATSLHGRFGMRVMALDQGWSNHLYHGALSAMPDDLADSVNTLIGSAPGDTIKYAIPDWNHPFYWQRLRELLQAIADHYMNDPHFAWIDVSSYGNWGEFHLYPFNQPGGPYDTAKQRPLSDSSARALVDLNGQIFAGKFLFLNAEQPAALDEILKLTGITAGFRSDCLGSDQLAGGQNALSQVNGALDHWRKGPMITEWCQSNLGNSGNNLFTQGLQQVQTFHISMLSSGNFVAKPTSNTEIQAFRNANVISGYRLHMDTIQIHSSSMQLIIRSHWLNDNVAPTYLKWNVYWSIGNNLNLKSKIDLRQVMPDQSIWQSDTFALSQNIDSGAVLKIRIEDVQGISLPLFLAIQNPRDSLGNYLLN